MKKAVCVLLERDDGEFLAVTRRGDMSQIGMPGGKVERRDQDGYGSELFNAAKRELKEETGVTLWGAHNNYDGFFTSVCKGKEEDYETTTFYATSHAFIRELYPERGTVCIWTSREALSKGPFGEYNKEMFKAYDALKEEMKEEKRAERAAKKEHNKTEEVRKNKKHNETRHEVVKKTRKLVATLLGYEAHVKADTATTDIVNDIKGQCRGLEVTSRDLRTGKKRKKQEPI